MPTTKKTAKIEYKFLNTPLDREIYYMHLIRRLHENFFQKNGFMVLPQATVRNSSEVVVPYFKDVDLKSKNITKAFKTIWKDYDHPYSLTQKEYKKARPFSKYLFPTNLDTKDIAKFLAKNDTAIVNALKFLIPDFAKYKVVINVLPVDFGTAGTFHSYLHKKQTILEFKVTARVDLGYGLLVKNIVSAASLFALSKNPGDEDDSTYWQKRQFLNDFLHTKTSLKYCTQDVDQNFGTLESISKLKQFGNLFKESKDYLKQLGFGYAAEINIDANNLYINQKPIYLTQSEQKVMQLLVTNRTQVCTFDQIAFALWGDNAEKFSFYAISRVLSDVRQKVKNAGIANDIIYTARKKGVLLSI